MTTQVFGVRPVGNCLQIVPLPTSPTPPACINQSDICIQQLQNFLNAIRPIANGGCITSDIPFNVSIFAGDEDNTAGVFLNPALDYRTQLILTAFGTPDLTPPADAIFNLLQVGIIIRNGPEPGVAVITDLELTCIINSLGTTFNRCQDLSSSAAQQIEAAATALISTTTPVSIISENTTIFLDTFIRAVRPGIIISTDSAAAPYASVFAYSTCFVSSLRPSPLL